MARNAGLSYLPHVLLPILLVLVLPFLLPESTKSITQYVQPYLSPQAAATARSDTPIFVVSANAWGHVEKIAVIAENLVKLGYPVTFITGVQFQKEVESIGATFLPVDGSERMMSDEDFATFLSLPSGLEAESFAIRKVFIDAIPDHHNTAQRAFESFKNAHGDKKPIIVLGDASWVGVTPAMLGAPGIKPDAFIGVGLGPLSMSSNDTMPFRSGQPPDTSSRSHEIHQRALRDRDSQPFYREVDDAWRSMLQSMGVTQNIPTMWDSFGIIHTTLLQSGLPDFEYPRSDLRPGVRFIGALPSVGFAEQQLPPWWGDITKAKKEGKKIIAVSQGSIDNNPEDLIYPTIRSLSQKDDVLVVATLVGSDPDPDRAFPSNTRVAKFIPFEKLMPFTEVIVCRGGYGTVQQALSNGVPLVISGVAQDKAQNGGLVAWNSTLR